MHPREALRATRPTELVVDLGAKRAELAGRVAELAAALEALGDEAPAAERKEATERLQAAQRTLDRWTHTDAHPFRRPTHIEAARWRAWASALPADRSRALKLECVLLGACWAHPVYALDTGPLAGDRDAELDAYAQAVCQELQEAGYTLAELDELGLPLLTLLTDLDADLAEAQDRLGFSAAPGGART